MKPRDAKILIMIARALGPSIQRAIADAMGPLEVRLSKLEAVAAEPEATADDIRKSLTKAFAEIKSGFAEGAR